MRRGQPLRIGVLGAARITTEALVEPARAAGHRIVAVAARDRSRAEAFAAAAGAERVLPGYADVLADPEVEVVYDPLANALHAPWNLAAVRAGKHVLTEKPSAGNAAEARAVRDAAAAAGVVLAEGFHYLHHPVAARLRQLAAGGELGQLRRVEVDMLMPAPDDADPRWSLELAGGAVMDLGCYGLHALRHLPPGSGGDGAGNGAANGAELGSGPRVVAARAVEHPDHPGVDAELDADLELPGGVEGAVRSRMGGQEWRFACRLVGTAGEAEAPNFVKPQQDDRVVVRTGAGERVEHLGRRSSYAYQLDALARALRGDPGAVRLVDADDAVATMELVDACYAAAGLPPRSSGPLDLGGAGR
ncbi:Gfo/Idh/MocA family protein [Quadrisphaera sp. DSM 44207]|uniref:Gfo/Idh/MocA family protein n=1 Tax=Quadrisphaera sp. DSM 44207 TaxID=1881057 RepID=UPI00088FBCC4|nr:Gfo/Idh/MocA family oxidoreductase [Quadrisphaera sp. DSM 44207]SDQ22078.1 Predicted dehydrogenase [Quadrisphaera sp. DSM 44207]